MESKQPDKLPLIVTNWGAAKVLVDESPKAKLKRRALKQFFGRPMTVAEAAKVCRTSYDTMKTWVGQFEKGKLLTGIDKVLVRGKSKDRYGPAAEKFVVPLRQVPEKTGDMYIRRLSALSEPFDPNVGRPRSYGPKWERYGALVSESQAPGGQAFESELVLLDGENRPILTHDGGLLSPSEPALWSSELRLELDIETAKAFQRELAALAKRFRDGQGAAEEQYRVVLVMMPTRTER